MSNFVPRGWSVSQLDKVLKILSGYPFKSEKFTDDSSKIGLIRIRDLSKQSVETFYDDQYEEEYVVRHGDILIGMDGDFNIVKWKSREALLNQRICKIEAHDGSGFDTDFLFYSLAPELDLIHKSTGATTVKHLSVKDIRAIEKAFPPLNEQQKIASILTAVDEVIESTQAQINKLKDLKTGMMQELLTNGIGHTEFKDSPVGRIPKAWEIVKLGSVLEKIDSGWSPNCVEVPPNIGEWGVLKVSSVTRGTFLEEQSKTLPVELEPRESIRVGKDDLLLTRANGVAELVGKCVIVKDEPKRKLMMSDKLLRLKPNGRISRKFLLHVFNSSATRRQIEFCWGGSSGQKNIGQSDIKVFDIVLPRLEEQISIGNTLTNIDESIDAKAAKLKHITAIKSALMQDLLTGKRRVQL